MNLTSEQLRAIKEGDPVPILLPEVGEECVLIRRDVYEQVQHALDDDLPSPLAISRMMRAAAGDEDREPNPQDEHQP
jgi:hypothetical protein